VDTAALLVTYFDAEGIAAAVRSLLGDDQELEIIVVDNSDDPLQWEELCRAVMPFARLVRAPSNLGFAQGCNLAMQHTDAEFLLLVNPDVRFLRRAATTLRTELLRRPDLAAVGPKQFLDAACLWSLPPAWCPTAIRLWVTESVMREPRHRTAWQRAVFAENIKAWAAERAIPQRSLSGGAMMIRRSALHSASSGKAQLFDPRFFMYFEDSDLCLRLRAAGWQLALVPDAQAVHSWCNAPHKASLMRDGQEVFMQKHFVADNEWYGKLRRLWASGAPTPWETSSTPLRSAVLHVGLGDVPAYLEASPHPNLWPSVGRLITQSERVDLTPLLPIRSAENCIYLRLTRQGDSRLQHCTYFSYSAVGGSEEPYGAARP
jgi:GT2 family glycosyltransferase